ncbi:hypothetical protein HEPPS_05790 [Candidatus Hepatoplasma crinochetorum]|uniref:Uncharacterized protein n=1 Tax=Candidatus Hepatoplasma crinochetorum TaxID=295596 RepID=A0A0G7ZNL9_9MOLU|nr:hypothetical protein HEPPS_05790 [Candidatus Hepatoplasma crinochetorum]
MKYKLVNYASSKIKRMLEEKIRKNNKLIFYISKYSFDSFIKNER